MEQKKILWIIAALGIFLLVIFLGTLILYSPQQTSTQPIIMATDTNNNTWVNPNASIVPETSQNQVQGEQDLTQDKLVQTGDVTVISQGQTTVYSQDGITTIDLTALPKEEPATALTQIEPAVKPVATRLPASTATTTAETVKKQDPAPKSEPAVVKPAAPVKPVDQYWVQAASFVSKANADKARTALVSQKIPAEVFTHTDNDGVTFYRVRVGPYTTKSEAEYWNSLIKTVDNFTDAKSYVTNSAKPAQ